MYKKLPKEVVQLQTDAESRLYNIHNPENIDHKNDALNQSELEEIERLENILKPMCCSELILPQLLSVKLKKESMKELKHVFDERDLKWNFFYMFGEVMQAPGHCIVLGQTSGKIYAMLHTDNFELTSPNNM